MVAFLGSRGMGKTSHCIMDIDCLSNVRTDLWALRRDCAFDFRSLWLWPTCRPALGLAGCACDQVDMGRQRDDKDRSRVRKSCSSSFPNECASQHNTEMATPSSDISRFKHSKEECSICQPVCNSLTLYRF